MQLLRYGIACSGPEVCLKLCWCALSLLFNMAREDRRVAARLAQMGVTRLLRDLRQLAGRPAPQPAGYYSAAGMQFYSRVLSGQEQQQQGLSAIEGGEPFNNVDEGAQLLLEILECSDGSSSEETSTGSASGAAAAPASGQQQGAAAGSSSQRHAAAAPCCSTCGAAASADTKLRKCAGCKAVRYCSTECQKAHWRAHRPACLAARGQQE